MTDEGVQGDPMTEVEVKQAMANLAVGARAFYDQLRTEGFGDQDALRLVASWVGGMAGGRV